jgi:PTS system nitrogen regulatory IIA component
MKILELLKKEFIVGELKTKGKKEVLAELAGVLSKGKTQRDSQAMLRVLPEREALGSTGIGDGIAIPHGKLAGLDEIVIAFGRSRDGIAYDAVDGRPVHLLFLLMAPENSEGQHLRVLAQLSRMLKDKNFRKKLMEARSQDDLVQVITEKEDAC